MQEYSFSIWNKTYTVKDENELALIFEVLSWESSMSSILHWNIIMELDEDLMKIITSYKWLLSCLKILDEKNSFLLLIKIGDILVDIVQKSEQLWEILSRISQEENKLRILKQIRALWLKKLIFNSKDLCNILECVYNWTEKEVLTMIGNNYIKELFIYPKEIYEVLHYLNNKNKDFFIDSITLDIVKSKIITFEDLLIILKWVTLEKAILLLKMYSKKQIKDLFKNDDEFSYFIHKLSDKKEKIFLEYLGINL